MWAKIGLRIAENKIRKESNCNRVKTDHSAYF